MEIKYGFTKLGKDEIKTYLDTLKITRAIKSIQQHHTYKPDYSSFNGSNHFELQQNMKNYHVNVNHWQDIGQHFTTFPDGTIVTGRSLNVNPAGIYGANTGSICIENLGYFDLNYDAMTDEHKEIIIHLTAELCKMFKIALDTSGIGIVYHAWFDLSTGKRLTEQQIATGKFGKSCPGTNWFGGNLPSDCEKYFIPQVKLV